MARVVTARRRLPPARVCAVVLGFVALATNHVTLVRWTLCNEGRPLPMHLCERHQRPRVVTSEANGSGMVARAIRQREEIMRLQNLVRDAERTQPRPGALPANDHGRPTPDKNKSLVSNAIRGRTIAPTEQSKPERAASALRVPERDKAYDEADQSVGQMTTLGVVIVRNQTHGNGQLQAGYENELVAVERSVGREDLLIYLRIQKTGSQTMWNTLLAILDGRTIWGAARPRCPPLSFCGVRELKAPLQ